MRATLPRKLSGCDNTCAFVFDSFLTMAIARFIGFIAILIVAAASAQSDKKPGYPPTLSGGAPCGSCNAPGELSWKTVIDRKSTRLNSSHSQTSYAVFCLKKKMRLYNTLTRQEEAFTPASGNTVRMYACGLTVYARGHIGNFRTFVCVDVLRRTLKYLNGHDVRQVVNFTDVDDRTIAGALKAGMD